MPGADAGRAAAGAAGIVSAFVLAQIFMCLLLPSHPPRLPGPSLSAPSQPRGHSPREAAASVRTFASNQSLKMCCVCMTARERYMKGPGRSGRDNYIVNFTGFQSYL